MAKLSSYKFITFFLTFFIPYVILIIFGAVFTYIGEEQLEYERLEQNESHNVSIAVTALDRELDELFRDLIFLSKSVNFHEAIENPSHENLAHLTEDLVNFSTSKKVFDQIRWLDETGQEIVRINYHPEQPHITSQSELQNKGQRYYFKDAFTLDKDEIYASPLDLNVEHGAVEIPYKPMIRIGMPVFNKAGSKRGIILLNYYGKVLLDNIKNSLQEKSDHINLINRNGYWLLSPKHEDEWGFMLGKKASINIRHPGSWKNILSDTRGQFYDDEGLWSYATVYPLKISISSSSGSKEAFKASNRSINHENYFWKVVSFLPKNKVEQLGDHALIKIGRKIN